jgi:glutathione S-transferase
VRLRLFGRAPSPFCMKVRAILDCKGVQCERAAVLGPSLMELLRRSGIRKVPAIARLRDFSHALEDWSDEALCFLGLYFQWVEPRGKPMVRRAFGATPLGVAARLFHRRRIAAQLRGQGTGRKSLAHITADLRRGFESLAAMLADQPFLPGDKPYLCDFAVNAQLVYMSRPPGSAEVLREHGALSACMECMKSLRPAASEAR